MGGEKGGVKMLGRERETERENLRLLQKGGSGLRDHGLEM